MANSSGTAAKSLFRALWRLAKGMDDRWTLRQPLAGCSWGTYEQQEPIPPKDQELKILRDLLPSLVLDKETFQVINRKSYHALLRSQFHMHKADEDPAKVAEQLDQAFAALRVIGDQLYLNKCSSSKRTDSIQVDAVSSFDRLAQHINGNLAYVFTYRVRISNHRQQPIQVMGRAWKIFNDLGKLENEVPLAQNAIVGQTPIIPPGHAFVYHSGTDVPTAAGLMQGQIMCHVLGKGPNQSPTMKVLAEVAAFPLLADSVIRQ